jgi:acyl-CoA synthetase (AMP-forming)/AMP-acid ligase II
MINRGGFKVYPAEVESVLAGLDGVVESAVVGAPDEMLGEVVVAFLSVVNSLTAEEVRNWCAQRMADYKVPGRIEISRDALPRNSNGKIQKVELRRIALADRGCGINP